MLRMGKPKRIHQNPDSKLIAQAAATAVYSPSEFHCPGVKGQPAKFRLKPASICPKRWSDDDATRALREAIARGDVSDAWEEGFPRYVWHRDGNTLYEARHTRGPGGSYHAYPIEIIQAPLGLHI
jgi:hypothetical protein